MSGACRITRCTGRECQRQPARDVVSCGRAYAGAMRVKGIRWVGSGTEHVAEMRAFAIDVLGLRVAGADSEGFVELAMADGAKLELFGGDGSADAPWLFERNSVVVGFLVDDIHAARDELAHTPGVELLGELRVMPDGYAWQHFRAPDGLVYELTADPSAA